MGRIYRKVLLILLLMGAGSAFAAKDSFDEWYLLNSKGKDIGYMHTSINRAVYQGESAWEMKLHTYFKISFIIKKFEVVTDAKVYLDNNGKLICFEETSLEDNARDRTAGIRRNDRLNIDCDYHGVKKSISVNTRDYDYANYELEFLLLMNPSSVSMTEKVIKMFDTKSMGVLLGTIENKGAQKAKYDGGTKELNVIGRWTARSLSDLYYDSDWKKLRESGKDYEITLATKDKIVKQYKGAVE